MSMRNEYVILWHTQGLAQRFFRVYCREDQLFHRILRLLWYIIYRACQSLSLAISLLLGGLKEDRVQVSKADGSVP